MEQLPQPGSEQDSLERAGVNLAPKFGLKDRQKVVSNRQTDKGTHGESSEERLQQPDEPVPQDPCMRYTRVDANTGIRRSNRAKVASRVRPPASRLVEHEFCKLAAVSSAAAVLSSSLLERAAEKPGLPGAIRKICAATATLITNYCEVYNC